ncbi:NAD(P)-binding Rossmann-fold superfamily protein [Actinidia rufa]|uniref:NAD(P)-binding Rossmann-fold superfamily protein n=1 Tax=Actinidia rufa TaxID=165716 RepID=A0A7J0DBZ4_9ERIC|nr:NAD(P)-binding Rossmann-fold superfamily protein [Actinidia rufa]
MLETVKYLIGSNGPSGYGSKSTAEQVTESCADLRFVTAIITGVTSGIGAETARVLAKRGARLVLPARNLKAAEDAKARIVSEFPQSQIILMALDLSSLNSIRSFDAEFESLHLPLHLLINNAGKFSHDHAISKDGIEMTFATNYLGHFLLTKLLLKKMIETAAVTGVQGRIVNVSSSIHGWFSGDLIRCLEQITKNKRCLCSLQARERFAHQGTRTETTGNGSQRKGELCSSRYCENQTHQGPGEPLHRSLPFAKPE